MPPKQPIEERIDTGHPLTKQVHAAEDMMKRLNASKEHDDFKIEQASEWKKCVNSLASTKEGKMFLRTMVTFCQLHTPKRGQGAERLLKVEGAQSFYLEVVRPYLERELRADIE
jgi:hypothetical protein